MPWEKERARRGGVSAGDCDFKQSNWEWLLWESDVTSGLKEVRKLAVWISGGRELQKDGTARAKVKKWEYIRTCSRNTRKGSVAGAE